jgi:hypothetical protein
MIPSLATDASLRQARRAFLESSSNAYMKQHILHFAHDHGPYDPAITVRTLVDTETADENAADVLGTGSAGVGRTELAGAEASLRTAVSAAAATLHTATEPEEEEGSLSCTRVAGNTAAEAERMLAEPGSVAAGRTLAASERAGAAVLASARTSSRTWPGSRTGPLRARTELARRPRKTAATVSAAVEGGRRSSTEMEGPSTEKAEVEGQNTAKAEVETGSGKAAVAACRSGMATRRMAVEKGWPEVKTTGWPEAAVPAEIHQGPSLCRD